MGMGMVICTDIFKSVQYIKNIATGETSQAITPFHFFDYFHFFDFLLLGLF